MFLLPKFFVVLIVRTTASSPQSQMGATSKTLEPPPWHEPQLRCPQLLQEEDNGLRDIDFQVKVNRKQVFEVDKTPTYSVVYI